jgi:hypothetical protein
MTSSEQGGTKSASKASNRQERRLNLRMVGGVIVVAIAVLGVALWFYAVPGKIASSGGLYFISRVVLPVQRFAQSDPRWADDPLGSTDSSLGAEGCAVTSAAMVLCYYGMDTDPARLNEYLTKHEGYTPQGWLFWEKAADFAPGVARHAYEDLPSYYLIDSNLMRGNPVIVRIDLPNAVTHFVVITGKQGFDYLIQDPAGGGAFGAYPLRHLAKKIEALRFYERL